MYKNTNNDNMDIIIDGDGNVGTENDKSDDDGETIRIEIGEEESSGTKQLDIYFLQ
ncbi:5706_t:CDS:2 [Entrophospora sp. SA101]|nr:5706_t:CDS:2 [Entrophospora sp. SA101]